MGAPETWEPPAPVTFGPSPVLELIITNDGNGVRLLLRVSGELTEEVMVFGQEPCSAGRRKRRNVAYLGLLPPPIGGLSDITYLYKARYGEPRPRTRVFVVTCQEQAGWKGLDQETNALVPDRPKADLAAFEISSLGIRTPSNPATSQKPHMHKGCTRAALGIPPPATSQAPEGSGAETGGGGKAAGAAFPADGGGGDEGG